MVVRLEKKSLLHGKSGVVFPDPYVHVVLYVVLFVVPFLFFLLFFWCNKLSLIVIKVVFTLIIVVLFSSSVSLLRFQMPN